ELELARIDLDRAGLVGNHDLSGDVVAQRAIEHVLECGKPLAEIDHGRGEHLPTRKREQLPRETFAAAGRVHDHIDETPMLFRGQIAPQALGLPLTIISRLLKSWATPPVRCPIASSRWACRNAPSAASRRSASS